MTDRIVIHETDVPEKAVPGRFLRWVIDPENGIKSNYLSSCIMRLMPGETVKPAHSHPVGDEMMYIVEGYGATYINGVIYRLEPGSVVLFPEGQPHCVRNDGEVEMKAVCVYGPPTNLSEYIFHPEIDFDSGILDDGK